ncbi:MAG: hypothetical protein MJ062_04085 [Oscillospiraceae bacterium]|nr:hypothetical protein [Oscillospiraceae bacterium]
MAETKKKSTAEDIRTAFAFLFFGVLIVLVAFFQIGKASVMSKRSKTVKAQITHYEYIQELVVDNDTEETKKEPKKQYYVTFAYKGTVYQNVPLKEAGKAKEGDEIKITVLKTYESNGQQTADITYPKADKRKAIGTFLVGLLLTAAGVFLYRKATSNSVFGSRTLINAETYTGVVKRCYPLNLIFFDNYYGYLIAYSINNEPFWKRVYGSCGAIAEGTVLPVRANASSPNACRFDLTDTVREEDVPERAAEIQYLKSLPMDQQEEKSTSFRITLLALVVSLVLAVIGFILGAVLDESVDAIFTGIGFICFVFGVAAAFRLFKKLRNKE